ncbi:MAG: MCP four helix bundle domain-containing protein [Anaerolineales bacterium]|nr:MCP four helix bundle domain-containing protein [Anaerolineales bacterium]
MIGGFGAVVVLMIIIAAVGYMSMNTINQGSESLYTDQTLPIREVSSANSALWKLRGICINSLVFRRARRNKKRSKGT